MNKLTKIENATMSSLEIAELTGKHHRHVLRDIRELIESFKDSPELGSGFKSSSYTAGNGKQEICFELDFVASTCLITGYDAVSRMRVIKRWQSLENKNTTQLAIPQNYSEALKLAYEQSLVIEDQSRRLAEKDSLIRASNEASIKAGEILVREFVKSVDIIDLGERQFYAWMREQGFIMESREPYQRYVRLSYFTWKPTDVEHGGKYRYTLRITPRGKIWLSNQYLAWLDCDTGEAA